MTEDGKERALRPGWTTGACATGAVTGVASAGFAGSAAFWQPTMHIITNSMKG